MKTTTTQQQINKGKDMFQEWLSTANMSMEDLYGELPPSEDPYEFTRTNQEDNDTKTDNKKFKVFVYGSLRKGFSNHSLLGKSKCLGTFTTKKKYVMKSLGRFPGVFKVKRMCPDTTDLSPSETVRKFSLYRPVEGELYEVDIPTLQSLDALESNGSFYLREKIPLKEYDENVWMYICLWDSTRYPLVYLNLNRSYDWKFYRQKKIAEYQTQ